jgi:hypothetical protein
MQSECANGDTYMTTYRKGVVKIGEKIKARKHGAILTFFTQITSDVFCEKNVFKTQMCVTDNLAFL